MSLHDYEAGFAAGEADAFYIRQGIPPNTPQAAGPHFPEGHSAAYQAMLHGYADGFTPRSAGWMDQPEPIKRPKETGEIA